MKKTPLIFYCDMQVWTSWKTTSIDYMPFLWLKSKCKTRWTQLSIVKNVIIEDGEREFD
jgi:hypothetical protein